MYVFSMPFDRFCIIRLQVSSFIHFILIINASHKLFFFSEQLFNKTFCADLKVENKTSMYFFSNLCMKMNCL